MPTQMPMLGYWWYLAFLLAIIMIVIGIYYMTKGDFSFQYTGAVVCGIIYIVLFFALPDKIAQYRMKKFAKMFPNMPRPLKVPARLTIISDDDPETATETARIRINGEFAFSVSAGESRAAPVTFSRAFVEIEGGVPEKSRMELDFSDGEQVDMHIKNREFIPSKTQRQILK
jgi:hypothetical protein